mmetsp:Transcript_38219/g.62534  ORF Transcript_38219/g.62534 Transcript_38219/m.62534 type:complete len:104 (-) Transcript_38219:59-370(-)
MVPLPTEPLGQQKNNSTIKSSRIAAAAGRAAPITAERRCRRNAYGRTVTKSGKVIATPKNSQWVYNGSRILYVSDSATSRYEHHLRRPGGLRRSTLWETTTPL